MKRYFSLPVCLLLTAPLLVASVASAEKQILKVQDLPKGTVCFRQELNHQQKDFQIVGFSTNGACSKTHGPGDELPVNTVMDVYISTSVQRAQGSKNIPITVVRKLMSNVREVVSVKADDRGSILLETVTFQGCGSDCYYDTSITSLQFSDFSVNERLQGIVVEEAVRFIDRTGTNKY